MRSLILVLFLSSSIAAEVIFEITDSDSVDTSLEQRGTPVFHFKPGDVKSLGIESISRSRQVGARWRHAVSVGSLAGAGRYVMPFVNDAGELVAKRTATTRDPHTMFRLIAPRLYKGGSLHYGRTYRIAMRVQPVDFREWPDGWAVAFQSWGPTYPTDAVWKNPPLFVRVRGGKWEVGVKGGDPRHEVAERMVSWPFTSAMLTIELEYRPATADGLLRVTVNNKAIGEFGGVTCCTHVTDRAGVLTFGQYGAVGTGFLFRELLVEEI